MNGEILFKSDIKAENTDRKVAVRIMEHIPCHLPKDYSRPLRFHIWLMLQKDPSERPSAKRILAFLESLIDK